MIQRILQAAMGLINTLAAVGLVGLFLWIVGAVDRATVATAGAHHAAALRGFVGLVGSIPWATLITILLLGVAVLSVALAWRRIYFWLMTKRPINVRLVD
jgi:hypothetical protein